MKTNLNPKISVNSITNSVHDFPIVILAGKMISVLIGLIDTTSDSICVSPSKTNITLQVITVTLLRDINKSLT